MCTVCGCSDGETKVHGQPHSHSHSHAHGHHHHHHDHHHYREGPAGTQVPGMSQERLIEIETDILAKNDSYAMANRSVLAALGVFAVNLVSSPGSGKTTLLCKTIDALGDQPLAVIEGDFDAVVAGGEGVVIELHVGAGVGSSRGPGFEGGHVEEVFTLPDGEGGGLDGDREDRREGRGGILGLVDGVLSRDGGEDVIENSFGLHGEGVG